MTGQASTYSQEKIDMFEFFIYVSCKFIYVMLCCLCAGDNMVPEQDCILYCKECFIEMKVW